MRCDMAKVIVERPRYGSRSATKGKGYDRRTARLGWEEQPKREGIKVRGGGQKSLNEHLTPLRRYLAGQVGRAWDKIFADVCRYLDRNSAVQDHVRDHLEDYVARCVIVQGGKLYRGTGYGVGRPLYSLFYVCPRTGILKKNPRPRSRYFERVEKLAIQPLGDRTGLVRRDGVWNVITWEKVPATFWIGGGPISATHVSHWDALLKTKLYREEALRIYGRAIHVVSARRACKREVRRLVNSYPYPNIVR